MKKPNIKIKFRNVGAQMNYWINLLGCCWLGETVGWTLSAGSVNKSPEQNLTTQLLLNCLSGCRPGSWPTELFANVANNDIFKQMRASPASRAGKTKKSINKNDLFCLFVFFVFVAGLATGRFVWFRRVALQLI